MTRHNNVWHNSAYQAPKPFRALVNRQTRKKNMLGALLAAEAPCVNSVHVQQTRG
jgi:hypothetical protein